MEKNYYDEIIEQIELLINEEKWNDALFMIKTELQVPYVPEDFERKFTELENKVKTLSIGDRDARTINEELIVKNLFASEKSLRVLSLVQFENLNASKYIDEIKKVFNEDINDNEEKTLLLIQLNGQKMNEEFTIKKLNREMQINPSTFKLDEFMNLFKEVMFIYYKIDGEKNITVQKHFSDLLMSFINFYIPFKITFDPWELFLGIMKSIKDMLNEEFDDTTMAHEYEVSIENITKVKTIIKEILESGV